MRVNIGRAPMRAAHPSGFSRAKASGKKLFLSLLVRFTEAKTDFTPK